MKKILYVRNGPYKVNPNLYNLQEIGFCKALCKKGFDCDIIYYSDIDKDEEIYVDNFNGKKINLLWRKGYKILRTGIYPSLLKKDFVNKYDLIITTEYSQIMSLLWTRYNPKVVLYNGPYYNMFKIPFTEKIYDVLFTKKLNKNLDKVFTKSDLAKEYLEKKGFENIDTLGVGLDTDIFDKVNNPSEKVIELQEFMKKNKSVLYVGSLIERKNFRFTLQVFDKVNKENQELKLVIIGKGKKTYVEKSLKLISENAKKNIVFVDKIDNKFLKYIYPEAEVFLLPSKLEIFGMVLLESMYFGVPVITSLNGGSSTVIDNKVNGVIIDEFNIDIWAREILNICSDQLYSKKLRINSKDTIQKKYMWDKIGESFLNKIN
ncbi:glycosyl transferase family 1 [Clostridium sp. 2-1]|uniref:glycosyltransferase family 4 protein n=1 Tax=Clostridium TaxID=1485 RepID=UPI000CDB110D|nr:glycosyltransferase family 4 protein [Clostridium sp. 2-1]MBN7573936.1 glycosyltransferase family 4 protein [Clostridium beijerinckii]MBN7577616.1 glycosyltransferase family 4 protein [Clostridium beijerinckii]MBN7583686.1 glycosyltransferase family 4 protein [Clostridium beijerinckii]MBO0519892.1 glycosyltransferase family 4 protein [Clostridium beijerinckii]POO92776.1 glycosyl transferase family 1 [Clostridium sp. 2-1]